MVADLEAFDALLRRMTNAPSDPAPVKLEIYLFSGPGQLSEVYGARSESIRGFYAARTEIIAAFAIYRDVHGLEAQDVLFHEYAHHFMFQYFANAYPAWYVEGFAEFVAATAFEENRIVLGRSSENRASWLFGGSWLPMERIIGVGPRDLDPEDTARFYAQSWLFTHYIFSTPGKTEQFQAYIRALRLGVGPAEAFQQGFGATPSAMQSTLRAYLQGSPNALALTRPAAIDYAPARLARLPASADSLLPLAARLRLGVPESDQVDVLARIRSVATAATDEFAQLTLARAEATLGDTAHADAILTPLLETATNAEIPYLLGSATMRRAAAAEGDAAALLSQARRHFGRAYRLDANHVPSLYAYAASYAGADVSDATSQNILNALLLARQLAPQVHDIGYYAARVLIYHQRQTEAVPILRAIAYAPHAGEIADRARTLLQELEGAAAQ